MKYRLLQLAHCPRLNICRLTVASTSSERSRISGISQICLLRPASPFLRVVLAGDWVAISWLFRFCTIRSAVLCVEPMASARPATVKAGLSAIQRRAAAWWRPILLVWSLSFQLEAMSVCRIQISVRVTAAAVIAEACIRTERAGSPCA